MKYKSNRRLYNRVQRLINIKMAKAFRTTFTEALCIITRQVPIIIKSNQAAQQYATL